MTYWDNGDMLVDYIRHTFITTDESGVCEAVLNPPSSFSPFTVSNSASGTGLSKLRDAAAEESDGFGCGESGSELDRNSPDICMDYGYRKRTNTAKRLEDLRSKRAESSKMKTVHWSSLAGNDESNIVVAGKQGPGGVDKAAFLPQPLPAPLSDGVKGRSLVAKLIEDDHPSSANPFQNYAKFDASVNFVPSSKRISIWLHLPNQRAVDQRYPLQVNVDACARVRDLIGLVAWLYTAHGNQPEINPDINVYSLFMAEEDGEIDDDLPRLDPAEIVGKFGFPHLALVERPPNPIELAMEEILDGPPKNQVTLDFDGGRHVVVLLEEFSSATISDLKEIALQKREQLLSNDALLNPESTTIVYDYNIEPRDQPTKALPLDCLVRNCGTKAFYVVRRNARRAATSTGPWSRAHTETIDSLTSSSGSDFSTAVNSPLPAGLLERSEETTSASTPAAAVINSQSAYGDLSSCFFYSATLSHKLLAKGTEVQLVICLDRIEIIPPSRKMSATDKFLNSVQRQSAQSAVVHPIERIGGAETGDSSSRGRHAFRIIYKSEKHNGEWKSIHFEVPELATAEEIVKKLNKILDRVSSSNRKDYLNWTPSRMRSKNALIRRLHSLDFISPNTPKGGFL